MTAKLNKVAFKNLIGDHKIYCDSLKNTEQYGSCGQSCKVIEMSDDYQNNKQYVIVGNVLSKFIDNDASQFQNFKFELSQLTQSQLEAEIITEN